LLPVIADRVIGSDFNGGNLPLPRIRRPAFATGDVITTAIRIIDRKSSFLYWIDSPPAGNFHLGRRQWRFERPFSLRSVFVEIHRFTRRMDDKNTSFARALYRLVHRRSHFGHAPGRAFAPMRVPHITDDD